MKKFYSLVIASSLLFLGGEIFSQNVAVNTSGTAAAATNMFEVTQTSITNNTVGIFSRHSGTATNAYAIWAEATAGTNKYAIVVPSTGGSVGIGTITPTDKLEVSGGDIKITNGAAYNGAVYSGDLNWGFKIQQTAATDDYNVRMSYYPVSGTRRAGIYNANGGTWVLYSDQNATPNIIMNNINNVGIGITGPLEKLHVVGNIRASSLAVASNRVVLADVNGTLTTMSAGTSGQVLTSGGAGAPTWTTPAGSTGWLITGNNNIVDGTNFLGTTTNVPVSFRVNNVASGRIAPTDLYLSLGYQALLTGVGYGVVAIGHEALKANDRSNDGLGYGWGNVAVGYESMRLTTTGGWNTGCGNGTIRSNLTGLFNVALGNIALSSTTSSWNTAVGSAALFNNTTGEYNTAIGGGGRPGGVTAGTGDRVTTGSYNSFLGYLANVNVGGGALTNATAIGALAEVSTSNSIVLGSINGVNGATVSTNVGIGTTGPMQPGDNSQFAAGGTVLNLSARNGGVRPLFIFDNKAAAPVAGTAAGYVAWAISGYNSAWNTYIASIGTVVEGTSTANDYGGALRFMTKNDGGSNQERMRIMNSGYVGIGTTAPAEPLEVAGIVRATGYRCRSGTGGVYGGNTFDIYWTGAAAQLWIDVTNVGTINLTSDRRLKENIVPIPDNALSRIMELHPVSFKYKKVNEIFTGSSDVNEGFIADELEAVIPSAVNGEKDALTKDGGIQPQTLNMAPIVSVLTKAMQELNAKNEAQQKQIDELTALVEKFLQQNNAAPTSQFPITTKGVDNKTQSNTEKTFINDLGETRSQNGYIPPIPVINNSEKTQSPAAIFSPAPPQEK